MNACFTYSYIAATAHPTVCLEQQRSFLLLFLFFFFFLFLKMMMVMMVVMMMRMTMRRTTTRIAQSHFKMVTRVGNEFDDVLKLQTTYGYYWAQGLSAKCLAINCFDKDSGQFNYYEVMGLTKGKESVHSHSPELNEHSEYALCTIAGVDQMEIRKAYKALTTI